MTVIRKYFKECTDEELVNLYFASGFCEANCPVAQKCNLEEHDLDCLNKLKKYGLKEIEE